MGFNTPHWNWVRLPSVQAQVYTLLAYIRTITQYFRETRCWVLSDMKTLFHAVLTNSSILPANSASIGLMGRRCQNEEMRCAITPKNPLSPPCQLTTLLWTTTNLKSSWLRGSSFCEAELLALDFPMFRRYDSISGINWNVIFLKYKVFDC